jgi:endonuclease/exonuclease/phosphatase family metal-dependent hydrolase
MRRTLVTLVSKKYQLSGGKKAMRLTIMTFNVRVDVPTDGENAWPKRIGKVAKVINHANPIIIGMQELNEKMINDIKDEIPNYQWIGKPRQKDDEYSPILYRPDIVELIDTGTFWLSETPFVEASSSWDSAYPRICTWGEFSLKESPSSRFRIFNTHLDHLSRDARNNGVRIIWEMMSHLNEKEELPIILMGDFNDSPKSDVVQFLENKIKLLNINSIMKAEEHERNTFHDFEGGYEGEPIDYIFTSPNIKLLEATIITTKINGLYPSDHYPLTVIVELPKRKT